MRNFFLILAVLVIAAPALAVNDLWVIEPQTWTECRLPKDKVCYYDTASSGATKILSTVGCREITASFVSDISDNTLTANTAQVFRYFGTSSTADANDDEATAVEGITLNGNAAAGKDAIYGFDAPGVYFRIANTTGTSRAVLHCWQ